MNSVIKQTTIDDVPSSASFKQELKTKLRKLLSSSFVSFRELVLEMEGAYPTDIEDALRSLREDNLAIGTSQSDQETVEMRLETRSDVEAATLPEPHPLDYDWRFAEDTLKFLDGEIAKAKSKKIAILGAPTIFLRLALREADVTLYDKNVHLVEELQSYGYPTALCCDLFATRFDRSGFDLVVADPPWYPEHYSSFIRRSSELLTPGGLLLLSVLPRLTRPSATTDRMEILRCAETSGLDLLSIFRSSLTYKSPPFEQASLHAEGIQLEDWRRGDLFVFYRSTRPCGAIKEVYEIDDASEWQSFAVGKTVVRIRCRDIDATEVTFHALSPSGDVHLHSVSRRAPFRSKIDVWNSRNLALSLSRPDYLCDILRRHTEGGSLGEAVERVVVENNLSDANRNTLREIVDLLLKDAGNIENA
jgi:hypothetical protein